MLDTHAFLWLVEGSPNLSAAANNALVDPANEAILSVASVWELAIKVGNNRLSWRAPIEDFVQRWTAVYRIELLPIQTSHAVAVAALPHHHRDPFDRLLIAQAMIEGMTVLAVDGAFRQCAVPVIW